MAGDTVENIKKQLNDAIDSILQQRGLGQFREIKRLIKWYQQAEHKQENEVINEIKTKLHEIADAFLPEFLKKAVDNAPADSGDDGVSIELDLPSINTHVDFDLLVDDIVVKSGFLTITFKLDSKMEAKVKIKQADEGNIVVLENVKINIKLYLLSPRLIGKSKEQKLGERTFTIAENIELLKVRDIIQVNGLKFKIQLNGTPHLVPAEA